MEIIDGDAHRKRTRTYFKNKEDRVQLLPLRFVPCKTRKVLKGFKHITRGLINNVTIIWAGS